MNGLETKQLKIIDHVPGKRARARFPYHDIPATNWGRVKATFGEEKIDYLRRLITKGRVLDLGCADGSTSRELSEIFLDRVQIVGLDKDTQGIEENIISPRLNEPQFIEADGYFPPFAKNSFDVVFMMNNLFYLILKPSLREWQLQLILTNIHFVLKPSSFFCISGALSDDGTIKKAYGIFQLDNAKKVTLWAHSDPGTFIPGPTHPQHILDKVIQVFETITTSPPHTPGK